MHDWLGMALIVFGLGLIVSGTVKRRFRMRNPIPAGAIRPEFLDMGEMIRPLLLFAVVVLALKITLFYFVLGGQRFLTPLGFAGVLFVLAAYAAWLILVMQRPSTAVTTDPIPSNERSVT